MAGNGGISRTAHQTLIFDELGFGLGGRPSGFPQADKPQNGRGSLTELRNCMRTHLRGYVTATGVRGLELPVVAPREPDIADLTDAFLKEEVTREFWPTLATVSSNGSPQWPKDRLFITMRMERAFRRQIRNYRNEKTRSTGSGGRKKNAAPTPFGHTSTLGQNDTISNKILQHVNSGTSSTSSQIKEGTIDPSADRPDNPSSTSQSQRQATTSTDRPVEFECIEELIKDLGEWCRRNPEEVLPGAVKLDKQTLKKDRPKEVKYGAETAQIIRFQIDWQFMGYLLKCSNGKLLYLRRLIGYSRPLKFQIWFGNRRGFMTDCISYFKAESPSGARSRAEVTGRSTPSTLGNTSEKPVSSLGLRSQTRHNNTDLNEDEPEDYGSLSSKESQEERNPELPEDIDHNVKQKDVGTLVSKHHAGSTLKNTVSTAIPEHARGDTPEKGQARTILSSGRPALNECVLCSHVECIVKAGNAVCAFCTSTGSQSADCRDVSHRPPARQSQDDGTDSEDVEVILTSSARMHGNQDVSNAQSETTTSTKTSPFAPQAPESSIRRGDNTGGNLSQCNQSTFQEVVQRRGPKVKRSRSPSFEILSRPPKRQTFASRNTTFHFYLADTEIGAVEKSILSCNTMHSFFDEAKAAWMLSQGTSKQDPSLAAVSVTWDGLKRAKVIPWKNLEGFDRMMSSIEKVIGYTGGNKDIEIRCVQGG